MDYFFLKKNAISEASKILNINASGDEQDWEIEFANPDRIVDFFSAIKTVFDFDVKCAVAAILLYSIDISILEGIELPYDLFTFKDFFSNEVELREKMIRLFFANNLPYNPKEISFILSYCPV